MAKKKKISVLDYDPLAWLNDSGSKDEPEEKLEAQAKETKTKVTKKTKKVVKKKAVKKKVVKKSKQEPKDNAVIENDNFGFFADEDDMTENKNTEEEDGFGFFVDTASNNKETLIVQDTDTSNDENFGFFAGEPSDIKNKTAVEEPKDDENFGFFTDEPDAPKENMVNEEENEGFGLFSDDDGLDAVNTETLNITKDEAINLGSELTIKTVSIVKEQIVSLLSSDDDIVINAEEMIKIDTAGLQLLFSLKETLSQTGHHIKWIGTSSVINDSAEMIGMPILSPKSKEACFGFFEENMATKDADDGSSGFF